MNTIRTRLIRLTAASALAMSLVALGTGPATASTAEAPNQPLATTGNLCGMTETYTGYLSGTGVGRNVGSYYWSGYAGTHSACMTGPAAANFNLQLLMWTGSYWMRVAVGQSSTSTEMVNYSGGPGYYQWQAVSASGSGYYTVSIEHP